MESVIEQLSTGTPLRILVLLTLLTFLPGLLLSMTAFLRIIIVMGFLRSAIGLAQMPPNQVLIGLSLFLTWFVMGDVVQESLDRAVIPYSQGQIEEIELGNRAVQPFRRFMLEETRQKDLALMANLAELEEMEGPEDVPLRVLVPAFIASELRVAFSIGFLLFVPFLVIDLATAALLNALGMIMLPPTAISLPFKILVFVLADGWSLLVAALTRTFGG
ncbi:MAG TPA: flagellar type III secretion system pore protein FliP [Myxococcales bacterium LLY-WYZ-16_1]|jgi:flagellar biosynthetic protein FliP|nr:flagellar type III secretion system pore protein FliP [Myxococcales bacterium LLY-WYZ-16_1]